MITSYIEKNLGLRPIYQYHSKETQYFYYLDSKQLLAFLSKLRKILELKKGNYQLTWEVRGFAYFQKEPQYLIELKIGTQSTSSMK